GGTTSRLGGRRRLRRRGRVGRLGPHRGGLQLRRRHRRRVERRLAPGDFQRHFGGVDDAAVTAGGTLVVGRTHEDAVDRAGVDAQGAEHALGVVDLEAVDLEGGLAAHLDLFLLDVDAVDGAGPGALVAADAGGQIEAVEAAVARLDGDRQLGVL